eukprot:1146847-Pelagomonas_calceolata.AAC.2
MRVAGLKQKGACDQTVRPEQKQKTRSSTTAIKAPEAQPCLRASCRCGPAHLNAGKGSSSDQSLNAFLVNREELVHGTVLPTNQFQSILSSHGTEIAELICRCCNISPSDRPCFVEVCFWSASRNV